MKINCDLFGISLIYLYLCSQSEKDSLWQKKRYAPNLRSGNVGNFQKARLIATGEQNGFHALICAWGCTPILVIGFFPTTPTSELAKAVPRFCRVDTGK